MKYQLEINLKVLLAGLFVFVISLSGAFMLGQSQLRAAALGWTQNDWSLGADLAAIANSTLNQTGWQKFYSKTSNIDVSTPGQIKLSDPNSNTTQTSDADFNGGAVDNNTYIAGGNVNLKKQNDRPCIADTECASTHCSTSTNLCAVSPWISGVCSGISVYNVDTSGGAKAWKTSQTACVSPQCSEGLLVADNNVDFSEYPARNACKILGGRIPTQTELNCIYTNRASLGNNFQSGNYWLNLQCGDPGAYMLGFSGGVGDSGAKTNPQYVRCVKTQ